MALMEMWVDNAGMQQGNETLSEVVVEGAVNNGSSAGEA